MLRSNKTSCVSALLLSFALVLAAGCTAPAANETPAAQDGMTSAATEAEPALRFTDMGGNEITLAAPATRIVALTPADVEILFAIGAGDTLVGCGEYCNAPAEAMDIPVMQTGTQLNVEQLIAAKPEVLLLNPQMLATDSAAAVEQQVERLAQAHISVVISNAIDLAGVYEAVSMLGILTGHGDAADAVIGNMREAFSQIDEARVGSGKTVYFEISPLEYGLWAAGSGTFMDEIAGMLGLTNCFADVVDYGAVSEEQVIERNPDYIVTIAMYFGEGPTPVEEILARKGWEGVTAVQNGAILNLQNDELSRPGPRLADGARLLSDFIDGAVALDRAA